jgi:hypothetical protein
VPTYFEIVKERNRSNYLKLLKANMEPVPKCPFHGPTHPKLKTGVTDLSLCGWDDSPVVKLEVEGGGDEEAHALAVRESQALQRIRSSLRRAPRLCLFLMDRKPLPATAH